MSAPEFERVIAAHDAQTGPITGYWTCACGAQSDNTQTCKGGPEPFDRRADHRAHLSAALNAEVDRWLGDEGTREVVAAALLTAGVEWDGKDTYPARVATAALVALTTTDPTANGAP